MDWIPLIISGASGVFGAAVGGFATYKVSQAQIRHSEAQADKSYEEQRRTELAQIEEQRWRDSRESARKVLELLTAISDDLVEFVNSGSQLNPRRTDSKIWSPDRTSRIEVESAQLVSQSTRERLHAVLAYRIRYRDVNAVVEDFSWLRSAELALHGIDVITAYIRGDTKYIPIPSVFSEINALEVKMLELMEESHKEDYEAEQAAQQYEAEQARSNDK